MTHSRRHRGRRDYADRVTYGAGGVGPADRGGAALRRRDDLGRRGVVLLAVGSALTLLFAMSLWSWRTFASSEGFADVATDTLKEPAVAEAVADQIVNVLQDQVATAQYAVGVRPLLRQVVAEVVATEAFKGLFHAGVRELHGAVVQGTRTRLLVPVDDAAELVKEALAVVNPGMAECSLRRHAEPLRRGLAEPVGRPLHARRRPRRMADPAVGGRGGRLLRRGRPPGD